MRRPVGRGWLRPARSDLPALLIAVSFAVAALLPAVRGPALAVVPLAAAGWMAWDAVRNGQHGARARLVMAVALLLLAALPALLLAFDHRLWVAPPELLGLNAGLELWAVGIAAIAVGSRIGAAGQPRRDGSATAVGESRGRPAVALLALVVLASVAAFVHEVGGPVAYLRHLNDTGATTAGLTYLIWGVSFAKFGAYACIGERWARGRRPSKLMVLAACTALLLLLFLGSRLLVLVALLQLLLLYAALRPLGHRFKAILSVAAVLGVAVFLLLGEFRTWENVPGRPSFPTYFVKIGLPQLPRTYVNSYADTVRSSVLVRQIVPHRAGYEDGTLFLRVLVQPIPSSIRPRIPIATALNRAFTSGDDNGAALSAPDEGYIEFGLPGAVGLCIVLGLLVGIVDRFGAAKRDVGWTLASIAAGTGLVIAFRGSLPNGVALGAIDVVGMFVAHRILYRPAHARFTETRPAVEEPGDRAPRDLVVANQAGDDA